MKICSCIRTCSTAAADETEPLPGTQTPSPILLLSDTSSLSSTSQNTRYSSLQSNLSLQTLPSVPSLQKLSPETLKYLSATHLCLDSHKPRPLHISFLGVHNNFLYAASGYEINVFDISNYKHIDTFNNRDSSSGFVKYVAFCKGKILTAHQDFKMRIWKLTENQRHELVATVPTLKDRLRHAIFPKSYVKVRRHKQRLWIEHSDAVSGLAVTDSLMCSVSWDKCLKIWRVSDFRCVESVKAHDDAINAVVVSVDGKIYTASADRRIKVWARSFGERQHVLIATLEKHKSAVNALALNGDGSVLFSGACDRSILVWEREDSANHMVVTGALRGHSRAILCLVNVFDLLLSGSADRTARIWQRGDDGRYCCLTVLNGHEKPVKSLVAVAAEKSAGDMKVFSGSLDGEIKVWHVVLDNQ